MEKFTKGDWIAFYPHEVLNEGLMSVETDDGKLICKAEVYKSTISEATANAHLIAAAPEMYSLLSGIAELSNGDMGSLVDGMLCKFNDIDILLAKARGEQ
jgi:hypothetical protein